MKGLTYFAAMMALFAAMILAQSSTQTPSDQSNSSKPSAPLQNETNNDNSKRTSRDSNGSRMHDHHPGNSVPDPTVRGQQPNSSSSPSSPQPQAYPTQTPAARAAATHTPDPGTCMNPAALQAAENGNPPRLGHPCD
jgi:cytoskeletal protein RodZ